ncbi:hypothetical protein NFI96_026115 [Prochilodus magdalenae]|nr:hypothetical protein NFI96_026115 [Prochilodus magdalenae]
MPGTTTSSFDLTLNPSPPTHRGGNTLDLLFLSISPLPHYPPSPCLLLLSLPEHCSTDTFVSSAFNHLCPLAPRSTRSSPPAPWLSDVLRNNRRELRRAERKWKRSQLDSDLHTYQAILSRFSVEVTAAKSSFYKRKLALADCHYQVTWNGSTIRRIRPFLSKEASQPLVQSLVISRLDYCNSLLAGLSLRAIRPLQLVQNAATRLFNLPKFTHVTPLLRSLHWLPVAVSALTPVRVALSS